MLLEKCVVAMDPEVGTVFEVTEMNKESFLLKVNTIIIFQSILFNRMFLSLFLYKEFCCIAYESLKISIDIILMQHNKCL